MNKLQKEMRINVARVSGQKDDGTKYSFQRFTAISKSGKKFDVKFRQENYPQGLEDDKQYIIINALYNVDNSSVFRRVWVRDYDEIIPADDVPPIEEDL